MNSDNPEIDIAPEDRDGAPDADFASPIVPQRPLRGGPMRPGGQPTRRVDPKTVDPLVREGREAFEKNDATLAELRAMQALQQVPDHLDALILLYQCRRKNNRNSAHSTNNSNAQLPLLNTVRAIDDS